MKILPKRAKRMRRNLEKIGPKIPRSTTLVPVVKPKQSVTPTMDQLEDVGLKSREAIEQVIPKERASPRRFTEKILGSILLEVVEEDNPEPTLVGIRGELPPPLSKESRIMLFQLQNPPTTLFPKFAELVLTD